MPVTFAKAYDNPLEVRTAAGRLVKTVVCHFEELAAGSKAEALAALERLPPPAPYHYVVIDTPEGTWGRDCISIYAEAPKDLILSAAKEEN